MKHRVVIAAAALLLLTAPLSIDAARVNRVARAYRGQIILLKKRPPTKFRSDSAFIRFLRANRKKDIWPKGKRDGKQWRLEFFAFFKRKHKDVEVKVKFFDITEGRRFVAGDSIYLASRGQPILASNIDLEKPPFRINRRYTMYITNAQNEVLATTSFWLRGKGETYSGRVTFTDEETR